MKFKQAIGETNLRNHSVIKSDIVMDGENLFWNNEDGWVGLHDAEIFTEKEKEEFSLPMGGEWITILKAFEE